MKQVFVCLFVDCGEGPCVAGHSDYGFFQMDERNDPSGASRMKSLGSTKNSQSGHIRAASNIPGFNDWMESTKSLNEDIQVSLGACLA